MNRCFNKLLTIDFRDIDCKATDLVQRQVTGGTYGNWENLPSNIAKKVSAFKCVNGIPGTTMKHAAVTSFPNA